MWKFISWQHSYSEPPMQWNQNSTKVFPKWKLSPSREMFSSVAKYLQYCLMPLSLLCGQAWTNQPCEIRLRDFTKWTWLGCKQSLTTFAQKSSPSQISPGTWWDLKYLLQSCENKSPCRLLSINTWRYGSTFLLLLPCSCPGPCASSLFWNIWYQSHSEMGPW